MKNKNNLTHLSLTIIYLITGIMIVTSCVEQPEEADLIIKNATIYTVNDAQPTAEAIAVKDNRIIKVGNNDEVMKLSGDKTMTMNLQGKYVYPGLIEGHAHLMGIGSNLVNVDLMDAKSYDEIIQMVSERALQTPEGEWIIGRGWHQDKWISQPEMQNGFPTHHALSEAVPNHPVVLNHASGHAVLVNEKAMEMAGINSETPDPEGGEVFKDVSGNPTGILNETAERLVQTAIPKESEQLRRKKLGLAIDECLKNGITAFHQAGSRDQDIELFKSFAKDSLLKLRMHVMVAGYDSASVEKYLAEGPQIGLYDNHVNVRSMKLYADGALGSRGAWLLEAYSDAPGVFGHNTTPMTEIDELTNRAIEKGFQVCTHAIGDRANREVLDIYEEAFKNHPAISKDHRFRVEHAQHIDPEDLPRFAELGVLPAMQAIHMSSDRPWAIERLGKKRIEEGAYMWSDLIDNGSKIINGSDAPVEPVNPLASFYASVSRKTLQGKPEIGYEPEQKMTREEALKSYTIWPAFGAFMEEFVGSIEKEKYADFTILDRDIMTIPEAEILETKVLMTIIDGEVVYSQIDLF